MVLPTILPEKFRLLPVMVMLPVALALSVPTVALPVTVRLAADSDHVPSVTLAVEPVYGM